VDWEDQEWEDEEGEEEDQEWEEDQDAKRRSVVAFPP
jgi:hypothetical protein